MANICTHISLYVSKDEISFRFLRIKYTLINHELHHSRIHSHICTLHTLLQFLSMHYRIASYIETIDSDTIVGSIIEMCLVQKYVYMYCTCRKDASRNNGFIIERLRKR